MPEKTKMKVLTEDSARFLGSAAVGNKPLIDAEAMASACKALGWSVEEEVVGTLITGKAVPAARAWLSKQLEGIGVSLSGRYSFSVFTISGTPASLEAAQKILSNLTSQKVGDLRVSFRRVDQKRARGEEDWCWWARVEVNLWVWTVANRKLKKKEIKLTQPIDGLVPQSPTEIKAASFWNSLYLRDIQKEAATYLKREGVEVLPAKETAKEKLQRLFDEQVRAALEGFTAQQLAAVEDHFTKVYQENLNEFLSYQDEIYAEWEANPTQQFPPPGTTRFQRRAATESEAKGDRYLAALSRASEFLELKKDLPYRVRLCVAKPNVGKLVKKAGKDTAARIRAAFIHKNTEKLSAILANKGNLDTIIVSTWDRLSFEGELEVSFEDGAKFTVRNKTVYKSSPQGKWFAQYPTTFHAVWLADGTRMKGTASELRMVTEFSTPEE